MKLIKLTTADATGEMTRFSSDRQIKELYINPEEIISVFAEDCVSLAKPAGTFVRSYLVKVPGSVYEIDEASYTKLLKYVKEEEPIFD